MRVSNAFESDATLRRVFSWLTRIGASPKFGSRPISWYQIHQCHAIDILKETNCESFRVRNGWIQGLRSGKWLSLMLPSTLFANADERSRRS